MNSVLDTLEISKRLKSAGFDDAQAEALTGVLRDERERDLSQLATKSDLEILRRDITIRLGGMIVVAYRRAPRREILRLTARPARRAHTSALGIVYLCGVLLSAPPGGDPGRENPRH